MRPYLDRAKIPDTILLFDGAMSRRGYRINRFARSMREAANRDAFKADPRAYMTKMELSAEEMRLVESRDWVGLQRAGGNMYALVKLAGAMGLGLVEVGATLRGESVREFLATRPAKRTGKAGREQL